MRFLIAILFSVMALATAASACPSIKYNGDTFTFTGGELYSPKSFGVVAGGNSDLTNCEVQGPGFFASTPDFSFELSGMDPYYLSLSVDSQCDAALVVSAADGMWSYDDDSNGNLDPMIEIGHPGGLDGRVDVWVGTYDGTYCDAQLTLETFQINIPTPPPAACPTFDFLGAEQYNLTGGNLYSPQRYSVVAGGTANLDDCANIDGYGFFTTAPDFSFTLSGMDGYYLVADIDSQCDAALLINTAEGTWLFDDDSNGNLDPLIEIAGTNALSGRFDVWVGTYDGEYCDATLTMETFLDVPPAPPTTPTPVNSCPSLDSTGTEYTLTGSDLYSRDNFSVVAGGEANLDNCPNLSGTGFVAVAPDFTFYLSGMSPYRLVANVVSSCDSTLLINTAEGSWFFDDDSNGNFDPLLELSSAGLLDGRVDVWVGTFDGQYCNATLSLETF
jgi:hypothetical protein